jgi:purine-binding chemotaxis protein CheW
MTGRTDPAAGGELIVVVIEQQKFAIDIMSVREIRGWSASTHLPHAPSHVLGMVNLRGVVLPVVDLGARLGLGDRQPNAASVVIVAEVEDRMVGLLVDGVSDILTPTEGAIQPTPNVGAPEVGEFVRGVITTDDGIVTLLSLDCVIPRDLEAA